MFDDKQARMAVLKNLISKANMDQSSRLGLNKDKGPEGVVVVEKSEHPAMEVIRESLQPKPMVAELTFERKKIDPSKIPTADDDNFDFSELDKGEQNGLSDKLGEGLDEQKKQRKMVEDLFKNEGK